MAYFNFYKREIGNVIFALEWTKKQSVRPFEDLFTSQN